MIIPDYTSPAPWATPKSIRKELTGKTFGSLFVLGFSHFHQMPSGDRKPKWLCLCECGKYTATQGYLLTSGHSKSCGCAKSAMISKAVTKHGMSFSSEYNSWANMIQRSTNPNHKNYMDYGARGISVDTGWFSFSIFYKDMGPIPSPEHSIERRNNNKGYCKSNCYWGTLEQQSLNKRNTLFMPNGEPLLTYCKRNNLKYRLVISRHKGRNWCLDCAVNIPIRPGIKGCPHR